MRSGVAGLYRLQVGFEEMPLHRNMWRVPCLPTDGCPNLSCSLIPNNPVGSFGFSLSHGAGSSLGHREGHVSIHASWSF